MVIAFLDCVAQGQLTQNSVEAFSQTLTGSVLAYNVSNEAKPSQPPTFYLWSYLEVRIVVGDVHADQLSFTCSSLEDLLPQNRPWLPSVVRAGRTQSLCQILCPSCLCVGARYKLPEAHLQHLSYHLLVHARPWASNWEKLEISKFKVKLCQDSHTAAQTYMCRVALQHCRRAWAACRRHAPNVQQRVVFAAT